MHGMKYLLLILVGAGITFQSFSKMIILINFQLNKEYIAKNLCVQKEIEDNCCKGSCHLKQQLQEEEKKEPAPANSLKDMKEFQIFCQNMPPFKFQPHLLRETGFIPFIHSSTSSIPFSIFHPPQV